MAEISDQALEKLVESIEELLRKGIPVGDNLKKVVDDYRQGLLQSVKDLKSAHQQLNNYNKALQKGRADISGISSVLTDLNDSLDAMDKSVSEHDKAQTRQRMAQLRADAAQAHNQQTLAKAFKNTTATLASTGVESITSFAKSLFDTSSGFRIAGDLMITGIDAANTAFKGIADVVSGVGEGMAILGKGRAMRAAGVALGVLGETSKVASDATSKLTKEGINLLIKESEKLVSAWHEASSAGAIMAGGVTEFRDAALKASLMPDELAKVIKGNSELLAQSGITVANAVKRVGEVGDVMRKTGMRNELFKFGIGVQEQAEIMADVMSRQRKFGVAFDASKVAASVTDLGKQMRIVADLTGEDAKKRMAETRKQTDRYATRAKIAEIAKNNGKKASDLAASIEVGLTKYDALTQKVYSDILTTGTTTETAAYLIPGFVESIRNSVEATRQTGEFQQSSMLEFANANKDVYHEGLVAMDVAGRLTGSFEDYNTKINAASLSFQTINEKTVKIAEDSAARLSIATDKWTQAIVDIEAQTINLKTQIQDKLGPHLMDFADVVEKVVSMINTALGISNTTGSSGPDLGYQIVTGLGKVLGGVVGGGIGLASGIPTGGLGWLSAGATTAAGYQMGGLGGEWLANKIGFSAGTLPKPTELSTTPSTSEPEPKEKMALGGIASKPVIAGEAGPEAIVPLPNGRSIPVDMDLRPLVEALQELLEVNKDNRDYLEKLFHASV